MEDDAEDEHENDTEVPVDTNPVHEKPPQPSLVSKETERQLSKKELKKKGLEELDAVLAELGYAQNEPSGHKDSNGNIILSLVPSNYLISYLPNEIWS